MFEVVLCYLSGVKLAIKDAQISCSFPNHLIFSCNSCFSFIMINYNGNVLGDLCCGTKHTLIIDDTKDTSKHELHCYYTATSLRAHLSYIKHHTEFQGLGRYNKDFYVPRKGHLIL